MNKITNKHAEQKILKARTNLLLQHYFWGQLALYLKMVEEPSCPTLAVDGKHIFYNPDFILGLSDELVRSAIAHEIGHCMFSHMTRRAGRDSKVWNYAGDYAINLVLKDAGMRLGEGWLLDEKYRGMSAEHIYDLLKEEGEGGGQGDPGDKGGPLCEIRDGASSAPEAQEQEMNWQLAVGSAARQAQAMGKLPAGMERFVDEAGQNKVPWRDVLHRFINQLARDDYTWARPNRKFVAFGAYMPSLYSERMGPIVVVIDTSGSIDQPTLNAFGAEIKAIAAQARPEKLTVIYCDAAVNHVDEFGPGEDITFNMHGGGGTDFRPPFAYLDEQGETPAALVYLTDMHGAFPESADFPVLWAATSDREGPFGETVKLEI